MRRVWAWAAAAWLAGIPAAVLAHAHLERAVPPVGGEVAGPVREVAITFSEPIEPRFSVIEVHDAHGDRVDSGSAQLAPDDPRRLVAPLGPTPPGVYRVVWRATSVDAHRTEGAFAFTIRP